MTDEEMDSLVLDFHEVSLLVTFFSSFNVSVLSQVLHFPDDSTVKNDPRTEVFSSEQLLTVGMVSQNFSEYRKALHSPGFDLCFTQTPSFSQVRSQEDKTVPQSPVTR